MEHERAQPRCVSTRPSHLSSLTWQNNIHTETCWKVTYLYQINWLWLCYLAVCQLLSKLGSISSLAHTTTRNMKVDLAREDWRLVTLKHDINYVKRKDRLLLNQHVNHTFPPSCSPEKTKSAFEVPTTFNLQGKKEAFFVQSQASANLAAVITDTASPSHLLWHL